MGIRASQADIDRLTSLGATVGPAASLPGPVETKAKGRPRHERGVMNKTESRYAQHLESRKIAGEILTWMFEGITLRLSETATLTMDFAVMLKDGTVELIDVKGAKKTPGGKSIPWVEPDAAIKLKWAAEASWFTIKVTWYDKAVRQWCERVY